MSFGSASYQRLQDAVNLSRLRIGQLFGAFTSLDEYRVEPNKWSEEINDTLKKALIWLGRK